jgi:hypothetical protein
MRRFTFGLFILALSGCGSSSDDPASQTGAPIPAGGEAGTGAMTGGTPPPDGTNTAGMGADPGMVPTPGDGTMPEPDPGMTPDTLDPMTPLKDIPAACKGFEVAGLKYSPGGSTLPNTCAPFDNIYNNPYAIRCVDADPAFDTGWPGDEWCILPPEPELGIQIAVSPADYANPDPGFVLQPGQETTQNYYENSDNPETRYFYRVNLRMRTGSHHIINTLIPDRSDGWTLESDTGLGQKQFLGAQRPDADRPNEILEVPPENAGLGDSLDANQQFQFNMHHFNFGSEPMLREVWANIWWKPESEVTDSMGSIGIFGNPLDLFIAPGERRTLEYSCNVQGNTRIVSLNGHRHAHTERFGVWVVRAGGGMESVYESFDYNDMPTYAYDSISMNPVPDVAGRSDGATSGVLNVSPGDRIHFVCDVNNTSMQTLKFANEVMTGEMCILFGSRTGSPLCGSGTRVP